MIPEFPVFKSLELSDKHEVETYTQQHAPYSDFNFTSMWCWDAENKIEISDLYGNLAVRFIDYITGEPFYSFIGNHLLEESVHELLKKSLAENIEPMLKLVPAVVIEKLSSEKFNILEDQDGFDYILSIEKLSTYDGNSLRSKRNLVNRFLRLYVPYIKILNHTDKNTHNQIIDLYDVWIKNKQFEHQDDAKNELDAFKKMLTIEEGNNLIYVGLYIDDILCGFIVNELLDKDQVLLDFEKADERYVGIYAVLMQENVKILKSLGKKYLNYEQDLGLPGLRLGKKSFRPCAHLHKYKIY